MATSWLKSIQERMDQSACCQSSQSCSFTQEPLEVSNTRCTQSQAPTLPLPSLNTFHSTPSSSPPPPSSSSSLHLLLPPPPPPPQKRAPVVLSKKPKNVCSAGVNLFNLLLSITIFISFASNYWFLKDPCNRDKVHYIIPWCNVSNVWFNIKKKKILSDHSLVYFRLLDFKKWTWWMYHFRFT